MSSACVSKLVYFLVCICLMGHHHCYPQVLAMCDPLGTPRPLPPDSPRRTCAMLNLHSSLVLWSSCTRPHNPPVNFRTNSGSSQEVRTCSHSLDYLGNVRRCIASTSTHASILKDIFLSAALGIYSSSLQLLQLPSLTAEFEASS